MKLDVLTLDAAPSGEIDLDDSIFSLEPRKDILHRMVRYQLAKRRAGTHSVKGRSSITGTGAKMYKQKGTGNARHGDRKVPQFRGGGKAHGPQPRSHAIKLQKKVRALALKHALSAKVKANELVVIENDEIDSVKTGALRKRLNKLASGTQLIITGVDNNENFTKAVSNIPEVDVLTAAGINVYDILRREKLIMTRSAIDAVEGRFK